MHGWQVSNWDEEGADLHTIQGGYVINKRGSTSGRAAHNLTSGNRERVSALKGAFASGICLCSVCSVCSVGMVECGYGCGYGRVCVSALKGAFPRSRVTLLQASRLLEISLS